jgi:hypothetical protein
VIRTALALARRGLHVFPCRPRCKEPATAHGCKDATTDRDQIETWWLRQPDANVAVACGAISNMFALDIDAEGELRKLEEQHGELPPSVEVITARGRHVWFQYPDKPVKNTASKIAAGIDTRGDGGFVLVPPSVHPGGKQYHWSVDCAKTLAAAPQWLLDKITAPTNGNGKTAPTPRSAWRDLVEHGVAEGARDNSATRLAGHLLRHGIDPIVALELLQVWNEARCTPPLPPEDIERVVGSICKRELRRRQADGR